MSLKSFCHLKAFRQVPTNNSGDKALFVTKMLPGTRSAVCLEPASTQQRRGSDSGNHAVIKRPGGGRSYLLGARLGEAVKERRGHLQGDISFLRAFSVSVNQITDTKPRATARGFPLRV